MVMVVLYFYFFIFKIQVKFCELILCALQLSLVFRVLGLDSVNFKAFLGL